MNKNSHIINVSLSMALVAQSLSRDCNGEGSENLFYFSWLARKDIGFRLVLSVV